MFATHSNSSKANLLDRLKAIFAGLSQCKLVNLRSAYQLSDDKVRIPFEGFPIQLRLGDDQGKTLHLYPEYSVNPEGGQASGSYILFDPERYYREISGFLRLCPGGRLTLGRDEPGQQAMVEYPPSVAGQHLRLTHAGDAIVFRNLAPDGSCLSPLLDEEKLCRLDKLRRIRELFGDALRPLEPEAALRLLEQATELTESEPYRPLDGRGKPGGLICLPPEITPIVIGDLHAKVDNLLVILSQNGFLEGLETGRACLVFLGDAVHSEVEGEMEEMESSILIMDLIFRLKVCFPERVFFIRGNHESFSEDIAKDGIPQGLLWAKALRDARGKTYRKAMEQYYRALPYVVVSQDFACCHAAPPKSKVSLDMLVDLQRFPGLIMELINNRMYRPNRPAGYTKGDIRRFRKAMQLAPNTPFIVGHTPLDRSDTIWLNAGGMDNHHILYSAADNWVGVFTRIGGEMVPLRYPAESLLPIINGLDAEGSLAGAARSRTDPHR